MRMSWEYHGNAMRISWEHSCYVYIYIYNHPDVAGTMGLTKIMQPPPKKKNTMQNKQMLTIPT